MNKRAKKQQPQGRNWDATTNRTGFTERRVADLKPQAKRYTVYDDRTKGLAIRIDPNNAKVYFWFRSVRGKPVWRSLGTHPEMTVESARTEASRLNVLLKDWKDEGFKGPSPFASRTPQSSGAPTFAELVDAYVNQHVRETANRPEAAEARIRWMMKKFFGGWSERRIDEITVEDVLRVKNACGQKRHMANRCTEFVRTVYNWAAKVHDGKVNFWQVESPAKNVSRYDEKDRERFLEPPELAQFNKALEEEQHRDLHDFLVLAMNTGARRGDILSMAWENIHWEREVWHVPNPKGGVSYDVALLPAAMAILEARRKKAEETAVFVFPSTGRTGHLGDVKKQWQRFRKAAGIPDIRVHDLRRTVGSYLAMAGVNLPTIAATLGHRSLGSTQIYSRLHDASVREARGIGQAKMLELMRAATKRIEKKPPKQLPASA
jgi:integrase